MPDHRRPVALFVALIFLWSSLATTSHATSYQLPDIGEPSGRVMTPVEEQRLGDAFMREVRRSGKVIDDPLLNDYLQGIGYRLTSHEEALGRNFRFFLLDEPTINAFAGPAGNIGVHSGLILDTQTESELASVLAHEIAHVTQRHLMRAFDAAGGNNLTLAAALLAAILIGAASGSSDATLAAITASQAAAIQQQINFTRANEKEADNVGISILADSGFDPNGMADFFERLGRNTRFYDSGAIPEFLRTHPVTTNRIAESRDRAGDYPYRQVGESLDYHLLRATLKYREFDTPQEAERYFAASIKDGRYRSLVGQRYGHALALEALGRGGEALKRIELLLEETGFKPPFIIAKARLLQGSGEREAGVELLRDGMAMYPAHRPLLIALAEALLDNDQAAAAERLLESHIREDSRDARLFQLIGQAAGANGRTALGHLYLAESLYHSGRLEQAKRQLEIGLKTPGLDYYHSARISARMAKIDRELAERKTREQSR